MPGKISDKRLLELISQYKDADKICQVAGIKLNTLQNRVAKLTYLKKLEDPSQISGLYKPISKTVRLNKNPIIITRARIDNSDFKTGDEFEVTYDDRRIVLTKVN